MEAADWGMGRMDYMAAPMWTSAMTLSANPRLANFPGKRKTRSSRAVEGQALRNRGNRLERCQCLNDEWPRTAIRHGARKSA